MQVQASPFFSTLPQTMFNEKVSISTNLFSSAKIKVVSEEPVVLEPRSDTHKKVIAIKAPRIEVQALLSASQKLVLHTDILVIQGGYVPQPKEWDIQAKEVQLINASEESQWLASLIHENAISDANFNSKADPECNFDIPAKNTLGDRIVAVKDKFVNVKNKFKKLFGR